MTLRVMLLLGLAVWLLAIAMDMGTRLSTPGRRHRG